MNVEILSAITVFSVVFGIYQGMKNIKRDEAREVKNDASQLTTVIVKLESIGTGITEIKAEMTNVKNDMKDDREKIIRIEESLKSAWKRIQIIEGNKVDEQN